MTAKEKVLSIKAKLADQSKYLTELEASLESLRKELEDARNNNTKLRHEYAIKTRKDNLDSINLGAKLALLSLGHDASPEAITVAVSNGIKIQSKNNKG